MIINYNSMASNALRQLNINSNNQAKSMAKLSSGLRINSAADDAAGLSISEKMKGQINGLDQAARNAQDGQSLVNTAEGALGQTTDILQRMRELATQSANDTNTSSDRQNIQQEVDQLSTEITRISNTTQFNNQTLLNGGMTANGVGTDTLQIGANAGQTMTISINAMDAASLGVAANDKTVNASVASIGGNPSNITSVTIDNSNVGAKLTNGAQLTFNASTVTTATSGTATGSVATDDATLATAGKDVNIDATHDTLNLTVNGVTKEITLNQVDYKASTPGTDDQAALISDLQSKLDTAFGSGVVKVGTNAANGLTITSNSTGSGSSVTINQASANDAASHLGLTAATGTGQDAGTYVTVSDGNAADNQTIQVNDPTATSLSITSGNFAGVTINTTAGKNVGNLSSTSDGVTIAVNSVAAHAAQFSGGQLTSQAVATKGIDVSSSAQAATNAITAIDNAINMVSTERAKLGAYSNRLDNTINNLNTSSQNTSDAQSRIADVDMAGEMMNQSKASVLAQAAQAMLAQANQQPQQVLQLLRG
ncbi:flagellin [Heyndrickxia acidicola]|uniref:Flagellin n=1 Tax=Heyndrickxia acidicola TaxID=209389 RepID=A0ABU6MK51_9BACI|nr:flagellin [Heyndrickxia acidicola]MED1204381.1 flagellin [Heyndrickxia acidicola]